MEVSHTIRVLCFMAILLDVYVVSIHPENVMFHIVLAGLCANNLLLKEVE